MEDARGTPKSLREALQRGFAIASPFLDAITITEQYVVDFLNQKFATAYLQAQNETELKQLQALYDAIRSKPNV